MLYIYSILVAVDVLLAIGIIGLVLIQQGKGADVGAAFGSGASGTVFGARGSASFLTRTTAILAALFFINSLGLAYMASHRPVAESVINATPESTKVTSSVEAVPAEDSIPPDEDIESTDLPDLPEEEAINSGAEVNKLESMDEGTKTTPNDVPE